jgi:hypothetical protein
MLFLSSGLKYTYCNLGSNVTQYVYGEESLCLIINCEIVKLHRCCNSSSRAIALMMEAVLTSETSVFFNEITRRYIPESYHLHTRRRENIKSHIFCLLHICDFCKTGCNVTFYFRAYLKPRPVPVSAWFKA